MMDVLWLSYRVGSGSSSLLGKEVGWSHTSCTITSTPGREEGSNHLGWNYFLDTTIAEFDPNP